MTDLIRTIFDGEKIIQKSDVMFSIIDHFITNGVAVVVTPG
jgi:hypothetical protein